MNFWRGKKVLVTGATGLVGSWLVKELIKQDSEISCLIWDFDSNSELISSGDIKNINAITGDLADLEACKKSISESSCEYIFHLGAQTIVGEAISDPIRTFRSNIQGTWNILDSVKKSRKEIKSVVVASSDKAYGVSQDLPYKETYPLHGDGPYDVSKSCTDLIAQSYANSFKLPITIARCGNIYGGGDMNWSRIVPGTIKSLIMEEIPTLRSNGTFVRDYIHVSDIVDAYLHLAEQTEKKSLAGDAFNFSRNEPLTVLDIYKEICKIVVGTFVEPKILSSSSSEIVDQFLDSSKAHVDLAWESNVNLEQGLEMTWKWYEKYFDKLAKLN